MNHLMLEPLANGRSVTHYMATLCENKEEAQLYAEAAHAQAAVGAKRSRTCRDAAEVLQRSQRLAPAGDAPPHRPPCAWPLLGARAPGGVLARGSPPRRRQLLVPGQGLRPAAARRSHGETIHPGATSLAAACQIPPCHVAPPPPPHNSPSRLASLAAGTSWTPPPPRHGPFPRLPPGPPGGRGTAARLLQRRLAPLWNRVLL